MLTRRRFLGGAATFGIAAALGTDMARYFGSSATTGSLSPSATVTATKAAGNPTANFNCLIEDPVNVAGTYYAPYITPSQDTIYLASAPSRDGPWTAGAAIKTLASVSWKTTQTTISAPFILLNPDDGKYDLFYAILDADAGHGNIGFASCTTINGTYSDHGSALLAPGTAGAWDALCVHEPSVTYDATNFYMAFMGAAAVPAGTSEKLGIASAVRASGITSTWTKAAGNPISWGSAGTWNATLQSDPHIFVENGYTWIWTLGHGSSLGGCEGLWYNATDPTIIADWIEHPSNPILTPTPATWDSARCFRGGILVESGIIGGLYTGGTNISVLTTYKGGNFRFNIT